MSSRGELVGSAPESGIYIPRPTPSEALDLPVYINDELLSLGGRLNNVLEGGAFPPQSELPKRVRDGMMIFFTQEIPETDITSAGVWLYRNATWWKIMDDPSSIAGLLSIYQLGTLTQPETPPTGPDVPPAGWVETPPLKSDKSETIWYSTVEEKSQKTGVYEWTVPTMWSAGVTDGDAISQYYLLTDSPDKPPVLDDKNARVPRTNGIAWTKKIPEIKPDLGKFFVYLTSTAVNPAGEIQAPWSNPVKVYTPESYRGTLQVAKQVTTAAWSDEEATKAIVEATTGVYPNFPIEWDTVTLYNETLAFAETRHFDSKDWVLYGKVINGNLLVEGTVVADKVVANISLEAPIINGGIVNAGEFRGGSININDQFTVNAAGDLVANNALIKGVLSNSSVTNSNLRGGDLGVGPGGPYNGYHTFIDSNGKLSTNTGYFSNVVISDTCKIEKVDAGSISGDIIDMLPKHIPYTVKEVTAEAKTDVYTIKINNSAAYVRELLIENLQLGVGIAPTSTNLFVGLYLRAIDGVETLLISRQVNAGDSGDFDFTGLVSIPEGPAGSIHLFIRAYEGASWSTKMTISTQESIVKNSIYIKTDALS